MELNSRPKFPQIPGPLSLIVYLFIIISKCTFPAARALGWACACACACARVSMCMRVRAQLRMRVYVRVRMHVRDCGCRCAFVFGWVAACAPHACVCTGECVPPIASQELAVSHGTSARARKPTHLVRIDNRGAASIEASDPTQACLCATSGMGVRTHLTHSCGRRFCGTAITRSATMHVARLLRSSLVQLPRSPCAGHIRHGSGCCSAWRTASSFMRQIVHLVRSDDKKTSFASGDMSSQLAKDISRHRSSQLRRRDSLSNFMHAYVAGRRSSSLPSCLLALLLPAWLLPRSQPSTDRAIRISHCRHVQT